MMKGLYLHIIAFFLLLAVGLSSLSNNEVVGEKEKYEIEDSFEELKEGKPSHELLSELHKIHNSGWILYLRGTSSSIVEWISPTGLKSNKSSPKYLLFCSLKLCQ